MSQPVKKRYPLQTSILNYTIQMEKYKKLWNKKVMLIIA